MSILFIITGLHTGGAERHLSLLLPRLAARGIEVSVYVVGEDGPMSGPIRAAGIPVTCATQEAPWIERLGSPFRGAAVYFFSTLNLYRAIRRTRPAICHAFLPTAVIVAGLATSMAGSVRVIASRRSLRQYQAATPWRARLERFLMRGMDAVLGNSQAVVRELAEEGISESRLGLIYNGVEPIGRPTDEQRRQSRRRLGFPEDALLMVVVANLIAYKGHRDLISALHMARHDIRAPWCVLCVGRDDGIGAELRAFAQECGLAENVQFLGERTDTMDLYRCADISILASHQEGFSNTVLESMSAGLPVLATDVGGNAEALDGGKAGRLVPSGDPQAMAAAILDLARNPGLRRELGALAERRVRVHFSIDGCVDRYERLYGGMIAGRSMSVGAILESHAPVPSATPSCSQ